MARRVNKNIMRAGFRLKALCPVKKEDVWLEAPYLFVSRYEAHRYAVKRFADAKKLHIEGVRVDATALAPWVGKKEA